MLNHSYKLRSFDPQNLADIELTNLMWFHPETMKAKGYWERGFNFENEVDLTEEDGDLFKVKTKISRKCEDVLYSVVDLKNKVVGWIWFYKDARHPLPQRIVHKLHLTPRNSRVYQISYEKLMSSGWPRELAAKAEQVSLQYLFQERKGAIVEGLRLAISKMSRAYRKLYVKKRKLVFYAFTYPTNIPSKKVLQRNGFTKIERKYSYGGTPHNLWVKVV